jgi:pilus assembly protein Flp/PilA
MVRVMHRLGEAARIHSVRGAERGQGMVEYALILILIALVVIVITRFLGAQVNNVYSNISNGLGH